VLASRLLLRLILLRYERRRSSARFPVVRSSLRVQRPDRTGLCRYIKDFDPSAWGDRVPIRTVVAGRVYSGGQVLLSPRAASRPAGAHPTPHHAAPPRRRAATFQLCHHAAPAGGRHTRRRRAHKRPSGAAPPHEPSHFPTHPFIVPTRAGVGLRCLLTPRARPLCTVRPALLPPPPPSSPDDNST